MTSMRNRMHVVLWALLILFLLSMTVGGLVGGANIINEIFGKVDPRTTIGKVNGESISPEYFSQLVSNQLEQIRQSGRELTDVEIDRTRDQVWDNLVQEILFRQEIERLGITATDEEVVFHLKNNPPAFLQTNPSFQTDGVFDKSLYDQAINNPQGNEWVPVEQFMKNTFIPNYKLQQMIMSSASVSEEEVREEYIKRYVDYTINAIHVTNRVLDTEALEPSEEALQEAYEERKEEFKRTEQRVLRYVSWAKQPSHQDTLDQFEFANELIARIKNGEDFAQLANIYSEDPGNQVTPDSARGGRLGWFRHGQMVKPFEEAAFAAEPGEIVGPVLSPFGYHIILVEDKRKTEDFEEIKASHILLKIEMSSRTRDGLRRKAVLFGYDAQDYGFDAALDTHQVVAQTTSPFGDDADFIPGLGRARSAIRFAFNNEIGDVSEPLETDDLYAVVTVDSIIPAGYTPFTEMRDKLKRDLIRERTLAMAKVKAEEYYQRVKDGESITAILDENPKLERAVNDKKRLSRGFASLGRSNYVIGALLKAQPGDIIGPLETARGAAVIEVVDIADFDSTDYEIKHDTIAQDLLTKKQNLVFTNWYENLKSSADIIDNRKYYF